MFYYVEGTVAEILPTLIGLLAAVKVLRDSGLLDLIAGLLEPAAVLLKIPAEVLPLVLVKMFSASAPGPHTSGTS